jgi:hypothetical protein
MTRIRNLCLKVFVWATVASTLLASTPHVLCRCPDGKIKPFCFSFFAPESSSRCGATSCCSAQDANDGDCKAISPGGPKAGKGCCSSLKSKQPVHGSTANGCCDQTVQQAGSNRAEGPTIARTCCQKTLAQSQVPSLIRSDSKPLETSPGISFALAVVSSETAALPPGPANDVWQVDRLPPPTDLVTVLQRLTI